MRGNNLHEFTEGKSSLINLTVLCDEQTEYMDERKMEVPVDGTYLGFCKAFYAYSHNSLQSKLGHNRLDWWKLDTCATGWMAGLRGDWLMGCTLSKCQ